MYKTYKLYINSGFSLSVRSRHLKKMSVGKLGTNKSKDKY